MTTFTNYTTYVFLILLYITFKGGYRIYFGTKKNPNLGTKRRTEGEYFLSCLALGFLSLKCY